MAQTTDTTLQSFGKDGDLPVGIYRISLRETLQRFENGSQQRIAVAHRLEKIYSVAVGTGQLARFVVFGSFVTAKREPADVDVFLLMEDTFEWGNRAARPEFFSSIQQRKRILERACSGCAVLQPRWRGANYCRVAGEARRDAQGHHRNRRGVRMIANDQELKATLDRIARFQEQVTHLRRMETNPENYHGAVSGFLAEIDRMQLEVREYLSIHPAEVPSTSTS